MCFPNEDGNMSLPQPRPAPQRHMSRRWLSVTGTLWWARRCRAIPDGLGSSRGIAQPPPPHSQRDFLLEVLEDAAETGKEDPEGWPCVGEWEG